MLKDTLARGDKVGCRQVQKEMETDLTCLRDSEGEQVSGNGWVSEDTAEIVLDDPSTSWRRRSNVKSGQVDKSEILLHERSSTRMTMV